MVSFLPVPPQRPVWTPAGSTEIFGISVLVSHNGCDRQPGYEYCGYREPSGCTITVKQLDSLIALVWLTTHHLFEGDVM